MKVNSKIIWGRVHPVLASLLATLFLVPSLLNGQTPAISEDFQGVSPGPVGFSDLAPWQAFNTNGTSRTIDVVQDSSELFNRGTTFQFLDIRKVNDSSSTVGFRAVDQVPDNTLLTVSFLYYEPTVSGTNTPFTIMMGTGNPGGTTLAGFVGLRGGDVQFSSGGTGTNSYAMDTPIRFDLVFNNDSQSVTYSEGTLSAESFDLWADGVRISANSQFSTGSGNYTGDMSSVSLQYFSGGSLSDMTAYVGEVAVFEGGVVGAPIPEPGSYGGIFGLAALGLLFLRRGRSS